MWFPKSTEGSALTDIWVVPPHSGIEQHRSSAAFLESLVQDLAVHHRRAGAAWIGDLFSSGTGWPMTGLLYR
ncbi:hypothetical protein VZT92_001060 [Zoarces viviparus]|uniref:Uncharacterized protein n=1 Tax=Zoarces viviparus TaxID=48416 RepID=A0AAW1G8Z5_ZOAVI